MLYSVSIQGKLTEINEVAKRHKVTHLDFRPVFIDNGYILVVYYNYHELNSQGKAFAFIGDLANLLDPDIDMGIGSGEISLVKSSKNLEVIFESKLALNQVLN